MEQNTILVLLKYIEELESNNYAANNIIDEYIEMRRELTNKLKEREYMTQDRRDLTQEILKILREI